MAGRVDVVVNVSSQPVMVMWDGVQVAFAPGEKKNFTESVAVNIVNSSPSLKLEADVVVATEEPVKEEPKKVAKKVKK